MTFLEKARALHPEMEAERIITFLCPSDFGFEQTPDGCTAATACIERVCGECWNREAGADGV